MVMPSDGAFDVIASVSGTTTSRTSRLKSCGVASEWRWASRSVGIPALFHCRARFSGLKEPLAAVKIIEDEAKRPYLKAFITSAKGRSSPRNIRASESSE